jgi:CRP/FNR family transcriptional regulator
MDADLGAAVARSHLRDLPEPALARLMAGAVRTRIPAGSVTHWEGESAPHLELVISGLVRVYVAAPDGRTMTIRYCRPGALMGALLLFGAGFDMPATTQALLETQLLRLSPVVVRRAAAQDPLVASAFLCELSERAAHFIREIPGGAFTTVRQRVARHLLDLASQQVLAGGSAPLVAAVTQRELAEAVGTAREVVVRILRDLRREGVVQTRRDGILIVDPARLTQEQGWNSGS